jgi:hypothetical protein
MEEGSLFGGWVVGCIRMPQEEEEEEEKEEEMGRNVNSIRVSMIGLDTETIDSIPVSMMHS